MNLDLAPGWSVELNRGPGWLFVRLHGPTRSESVELDLADRVWTLLETEFANRLVLELDDIALLRSPLIGELLRLHKRICSHEGVMRLCGLSDSNYQVLRRSRLHDRFPRYQTRQEAVLGHNPGKPR